jgi:uncharacterized protein YbjT (DUF2867 family)
MKAIVVGATGMVGQGVVRECLASGDVESLLVVVRSSRSEVGGAEDAKLRELVCPDLFELAGVAGELKGYEACFFCLGVSASGMTEPEYRRVTYDLTLSVAKVLLAANPDMTFCYVSGAGTDATEKGRTMWARVKGETENALAALGFRRTYMFRPGYIQPLGGIRSKTRSYRMLYAALGPLYPLWKTLFPSYVTTTEKVGLAMIRVALTGFDRPVLENRDINGVAERATR